MTIVSCVLNTMQFVLVETAQTSEKSVVVVQMTTHQGIFREDSSLVHQILSYLPEIPHLN